MSTESNTPISSVQEALRSEWYHGHEWACVGRHAFWHEDFPDHWAGRGRRCTSFGGDMECEHPPPPELDAHLVQVDVMRAMYDSWKVEA